MPEGALGARHSQLPAWHQGKPGPLPDPPPLQHVLHAAGHGCIAADLQRIPRAHRQNQVVLQQGGLHAASPQPVPHWILKRGMQPHRPHSTHSALRHAGPRGIKRHLICNASPE